MFESVEQLSTKLREAGYLIDATMTQVIFFAAHLQKPLLLEGPPGSGKTQLALAVAEALGTHVERLQCYQGITEKQAIGSFDDGLRRLYVDYGRDQQLPWLELQAALRSSSFFQPGPLARALENEKPCVLLIDELDKSHDSFEAMLLEVLSAWQLSIPEFGTIHAKTRPFVVLTSNEERRLGDPIRRRCLYLRVEHPTPEREAEIIATKIPSASPEFHNFIAGVARAFRNYPLEKRPSVSEIIDVALALQLMGERKITEELRDVMLPLLVKTEKDRRHLMLRSGFKMLLDDAASFAAAMGATGRVAAEA